MTDTLLDSVVREMLSYSSLDLRKLPTLVDGPCPVCGFNRGKRNTLHHKVSLSRRLRINGWCVECGRVETLWDERISSVKPVPVAVPFGMSVDEYQAWLGETA